MAASFFSEFFQSRCVGKGTFMTDIPCQNIWKEGCDEIFLCQRHVKHGWRVSDDFPALRLISDFERVNLIVNMENVSPEIVFSRKIRWSYWSYLSITSDNWPLTAGASTSTIWGFTFCDGMDLFTIKMNQRPGVPIDKYKYTTGLLHRTHQIPYRDYLYK